MSYLNLSKNTLYSLVFIFPMLFMYELFCFVNYYNYSYEIRNSADVFIRTFFYYFGESSNIIYALTILIVFLIILYRNKEIIILSSIDFKILLCMLIESLAWTFIFFILMVSFGNTLIMLIKGNIIVENFYLSIGAGIWEEIVFRLIILSSTIFIFKNIFNYKFIISVILSIVISSVLFSIFHYIGPFAEEFTYRSFFIRSFAGILLSILYLFRGLGITVYTHIFYDMLIISLPTLHD